MSRDCLIVRDLMPLQLDGVCSQESADYLAEHMRSCAACRKIYEEMRAAAPSPITGRNREAVRGFRLFMKKRTLKSILLTLCAAATALVLGFSVYYWLWGDTNQPLPMDLYTVSLQRTGDGWVFDKVVCTRENVADYAGGYNITGNLAEGKHIVYVCKSSSRIPQAKDTVYRLTEPQWFLRDGVLYGFTFHSGPQKTWIDLDARIDEIRQGTPQDYRIIYRAGDDLPLCGAEDEQAIHDSLWRRAYHNWADMPAENSIEIELPGEAKDALP